MPRNVRFPLYSALDNVGNWENFSFVQKGPLTTILERNSCLMLIWYVYVWIFMYISWILVISETEETANGKIRRWASSAICEKLNTALSKYIISKIKTGLLSLSVGPCEVHLVRQYFLSETDCQTTFEEALQEHVSLHGPPPEHSVV